MWARVKGKTENAASTIAVQGCLHVPARGHCAAPRNPVEDQALPRLLRGPDATSTGATEIFPKYVTTTEQVGRAMIKIAKQGAPKRVLENLDINLV